MASPLGKVSHSDHDKTHVSSRLQREAIRLCTPIVFIAQRVWLLQRGIDVGS